MCKNLHQEATRKTSTAPQAAITVNNVVGRAKHVSGVSLLTTSRYCTAGAASPPAIAQGLRKEPHDIESDDDDDDDNVPVQDGRQAAHEVSARLVHARSLDFRSWCGRDIVCHRCCNSGSCHAFE